ncbi:MAG: zinc-ribbon domain-containing protein [Candidatus Methanofastidiosia archaeon]|jgi:hypothetical protein
MVYTNWRSQYQRLIKGLMGGALSWLAVLIGPLMFLLAGFMAVYFGKSSLKTEDDVIATSAVAGLTSAIFFSLFFHLYNIVVILLIIFPVAVLLSLVGGVFYAKSNLGIPINLQNKLQEYLRQKISILPANAQNKLQEYLRQKKPILHKKCPLCGKEIKPDWRACPYCKTNLESIICSRCGYSNPDYAAYCQNCGSSLKDKTVIYDDEGTHIY